MRRILVAGTISIAACSEPRPEPARDDATTAAETTVAADTTVVVDSSVTEDGETIETEAPETSPDVSLAEVDAEPDADTSADVPADAVDDSAASDGDAAGPVDAMAVCAAYCECMTASCASFSAYPFAEAGTCVERCATFTASELECFPYWCTQAIRYFELAEHFCEHAWGKFATAECPK